MRTYPLKIAAQSHSTSWPTRKREDIQALRGYAVLLVVLHHARLPYLPGGFLGVDVFFVISGFLMAGLIDDGRQAGTFSLSSFYWRRVRRLLPAAASTLTVTSMAALVILEPTELLNFAWQLLGSLTLTANVVLWRQSDYFGSSAAFKPLLHMWSLSIEEQFYLVFPALMIIVPRRLHTQVFVLLTAASAVACSVALQRAPSPTFYLFPTRAWELGIGVCAAVLIRHKTIAASVPRPFRFACALVLLIIPVLATEQTHPGIPAALMGLATATLLVSQSATEVPRALRPLTWVGDRSYSLYLVHWPLFAFANTVFIGQVPALLNVMLLGLAFMFTELQYRFVEEPFRKHQWHWRNAAIFVSVPAVLMVASLFVAWSTASLGTDARKSNAGLAPSCDYRGVFVDRTECRTAATAHTMVWGDSVAMTFADGLADQVPDGIVQATRTVCGPIVGLSPVNWQWPETWAKSCSDFNKSVLAFLQSHSEITTVVLASSLAQYVPGAEDRGWKFLLGSDGNPIKQDIKVLTSYVEATVSALRAAGKRVILFAPPPSAEFDGARCLERRMAGKPLLDASPACYLKRSDFQQARWPVLQFLEHLEASKIVPVVHFEDSLCNTQSCVQLVDAVPLYRDPVHLSHAGSRVLGRQMAWGSLIEREAK